MCFSVDAHRHSDWHQWLCTCVTNHVTKAATTYTWKQTVPSPCSSCTVVLLLWSEVGLHPWLIAGVASWRSSVAVMMFIKYSILELLNLNHDITPNWFNAASTLGSHRHFAQSDYAIPLYVITTSRVHWKSKAWSVLRVLFLPLVISSRGCIKYILFHSTPRPPLNIHTITHRPQSQGIALAVACLPQSCLSFSPVDAPYVAKPKLVTKGKVSNCFLDPICLQPWPNHV